MADDTTALVNEADDTRERIAATIDGLQDRLSPTAIVHRTVEQITESGSEAVASMKQNFGTHPAMFAAGGVAIGLAVLLHGRSSSNKTSEHGTDKQQAWSDRPETLKRNSVNGRRGEPLVGAVLSAVAGAVLAQVMPISPAERKLHEAVEDRLSATVPSLQHLSKRPGGLQMLQDSGNPNVAQVVLRPVSSNKVAVSCDALINSLEASSVDRQVEAALGIVTAGSAAPLRPRCTLLVRF